MIKRKVVAMGAVWATVTLFFLLLILLLDISRQRETLQLESSVIYEYAYERALINEVILHNFVELAETASSDLNLIRRYSKDMREHYPHILRFIVHQRVDSDQVAEFEQTMRRTGRPDFRINSLDPETQQPLPARLEQAVYYPVVFVEPDNPYSERIIGNDNYSLPANHSAMVQSSYYLDVFASDPYPLPEGGMGYRLFHALQPGPDHENHLIMALVIRAEELLPPLPHIKHGIRVSLFDSLGTELVERTERRQSGFLSGLLLPNIADTRSISRFGQSLEILVEKQLQWSEMSWPVAVVVLFFSLLAFLLTQQNYIRKKQAEAELLRVNDTLRQERDLLEDRVQERTWELVKTNSELRKQVKENRSLTQKVLSIQEEERRNISRELHDEMGQALTAVRTDAHLLKTLTEKDKESLLYQAAGSIDSIAQRIYSVTYGLMRSLRPAALDDLGLTDALNECIHNSSLGHVGTRVKVDMGGALNELNENLSITIYRLIQEALNNCTKHAHANTLSLIVKRIEEDDDYLWIVIEDDGQGFDDRSYRTGFGLIGMRERVLAQGGSFDLKTEMGKGTRIEVRIPLQEP